MKKILFVLAAAMGLMVGKAWSVAPIITSWSSAGGITQNRDTAQDIMYLVTQGDNLTFTVTVDQTVTCEWQVNKSVQTSTSNSLSWTVPDEKDIWEIHLKCWNDSSEEAHREWAVSTRSQSEAPVFFDYFTDLKYLETSGRDIKDPWDRPLPGWRPTSNNPEYNYVIDASRGFLRRTEDGVNLPADVDASILYGTWKFRYGFPDGNTGQYGLYFEYNWDSTKRRRPTYSKCSDGHHHCTIPVERESGVYNFSFEYDGSGWVEKGEWHQVTIIRTPDTWLYMYNDNIFEFFVQDKLDLTPERICLALERRLGHEVFFDNLEVYQDKYIFPEARIEFREYTWNYYAAAYKFHPKKREGIVVRGRNISLSDIAALLNDPGKFTYDSSAKTAVCKTDLVIYDASEFIMQDETLKFDCDFDGQRHFVLRYGADVKIENSTITTTNSHYFVWNNACSTTHYGRPNHPENWIDPIENQTVGVSYGVMTLGNAGAIRFAINNSVINNTAHIFFDSPMELDIQNTKFTNLRELDIGCYDGVYDVRAGKERLFPKGDKSFWVYTDDVNTNKFKFQNISFAGKTSPINVTFLINALRDKLNVYDLDLENENIVIKKSIPQSYGQSHTWQPYKDAGFGGEGTGMDSKLGLVNCRFKELLIPADLAWGTPKYYLDIKVVDENGKIVEGANVKIVNEVDDVGYPSENMEEKQDVFDPRLEKPNLNKYYYLSYKIVQGMPHTSTVTQSNGHTPLPSDKKNTLVIADYVKDQTSKTNFTYTITAEKDEKTASLHGLDIDANWYRENPNTPGKTAVMVLDGQSYLSDDTVEPVVSIITPQEGAKVFGRVKIKINAADNYGVSKIELYINEDLRHEFSDSPYEWIWDTKEIAEEEYKLKAVAYDVNNNSGEKEITVKVIKIQGIATYPNPYIKGESLSEKISFANLPGEAVIRIYTVAGKLVKQIKHQDLSDGGSEEWDVSGIAGGIYIYCIESSQGKKKGKVSIIK